MLIVSESINFEDVFGIKMTLGYEYYKDWAVSFSHRLRYVSLTHPYPGIRVLYPRALPQASWQTSSHAW